MSTSGCQITGQDPSLGGGACKLDTKPSDYGPGPVLRRGAMHAGHETITGPCKLDTKPSDYGPGPVLRRGAMQAGHETITGPCMLGVRG